MVSSKNGGEHQPCVGKLSIRRQGWCNSWFLAQTRLWMPGKFDGGWQRQLNVRSRPLRTCRITKKVHAGSQQLHNIARYVFPSKKWSKVKQKYQEQRCMNYPEYKNRVRTFCICNRGVFLCNECFVEHKIIIAMDNWRLMGRPAARLETMVLVIRLHVVV